MERRNTAVRGVLRLVWLFLGAGLIFYLAILGAACGLQRRLMYFPSSSPVPLPDHPRLSGIREVRLTASDGTALHAWYWSGSKTATFLIFHGNGGDRSHRLGWMARLHETGAGVFILDYRGYGGSAGSPSEEGLYRDGEAAADWIAKNVPGPVIYLGESLGSAVAVEIALRRPPARLVLQSAFTSAVDVGRLAYPWLPVNLFLCDRYDSISKIDRVSCPILCIHGSLDGIVPISLGRALFKKARMPKEWLEIAGADHNDPFWDIAPGYMLRLGAEAEAAARTR